MLVVIDGYNFIFTINDFEKYVTVDNIEDARERFISLMIKYRAEKKYNIVIVFDSSDDNCFHPAHQEISGLEIIYARYSKDADTAIKNMIDHCNHPRDTCVVTNDNDIKMFVKKQGSSLMSPEVFYKEIKKTLGFNRKKPSNEPTYKIDGPSKSESLYWVNFFKNESEESVNREAELVEDVDKEPDLSFDDESRGEPFSKFLGPSADETDYWLKFFNEKDGSDE